MSAPLYHLFPTGQISRQERPAVSSHLQRAHPQAVHPEDHGPQLVGIVGLQINDGAGAQAGLAGAADRQRLAVNHVQ